jgi:flagellar hook-associated protein 2
MPSIQSLGVGSGLDVSSIITKLMELEQKPLTRLQSAEKGIQTQISAYGTIQSKMSALDSAMSSLSRTSTWEATTVDTHGRTEVEVTASSTTDPTSLEVEVSQLAQRQSIFTQTFTDSTSVVGTGNLIITLGEWTNKFTSFTDVDGNSFSSGSAPLTLAPPGTLISITAPDNTLADVRDAINDSDAGVVAQIVSDAQGSRLVLRSAATGSDAGFMVATQNPVGDFDALKFTGYSAAEVADVTSFPAAANVGSFPYASNIRAQAGVMATNLQATINGVEVQSATNTLSNVIDGITLKATQTTDANGPITVDVKRDQASIKTQIDAFVTAYNDSVSYIKQMTAYNEATKTGGPLQGDQVTLSLLNQLRSAVTRVSGASSVLDRLSDIGITVQKDGSLASAPSTLQTALDNSLSEVQALFARDDTDSNLDGLAVSVSTFIDSLTADGGLIASKDDTLQARLKRNQSEQDRMSLRLESIQARLEATYSALDTKMSSMNSLSSYVSQQITAMNNSNSK